MTDHVPGGRPLGSYMTSALIISALPESAHHVPAWTCLDTVPPPFFRVQRWLMTSMDSGLWFVCGSIETLAFGHQRLHCIYTARLSNA